MLQFIGKQWLPFNRPQVFSSLLLHVSSLEDLYKEKKNWYCRHGIRQLRSCWADGPAYITQCPIQPGQSFAYNFTITGQRGTLLWHAHISWLRSTVHGAIFILPKLGVPYPFPKPDKEKIIILGEAKLKVNWFIEHPCRMSHVVILFWGGLVLFHIYATI